MITASDLWGPFALRLRCGPLELRAVTDDDLPQLVELALDGIHPAEEMPFETPWTDASDDELPRGTASYYWSQRAAFGAQRWVLDLVVRHEGAVVGVKGLAAENFTVVRSVGTGSWLGRRHQGKGIGTAMRQAVCAFAFDHLGAVEITSSAFVDNPPSAAVSRKVGYRDNGVARVERRPGEVVTQQQFRLVEPDLVRPSDPLEVEGLDPLRRAMGLEPG